ncbi:hypothetical protein [Sporosarcina sp. P1]|uniref:hypothetical protein n=1 Tax=Sporosarcina sp. P1 TaxID=2048257 RepID=UPI000C169F93|nr:hypothetical protein [Sporosarcina sp. P1]PIC83013.1 hypothetical protein CSV73_09825 [Sporosarcina sp. P1]
MMVLGMLAMVALWGCASDEPAGDAAGQGMADDVVRVYGPGGPLGPLEEPTKKFSNETEIQVEVTTGPK